MLGDKPEDTGDHDARLLLEALDYAGPVVTNLLRRPVTGVACSRQRPGLRAFSSWLRPTHPAWSVLAPSSIRRLLTPCMQVVPRSAFPGWVFRRRKRFKDVSARVSSIFSQLQTGNDLLESAGRGIPPPGLVPAHRNSSPPSRRIACARMLNFHGTVPSGSPMVARSCCRQTCACAGRRASERSKPPFPLGTGSAAGKSWDAAALHGVLELIERDAASLWWQGGNPGRSIPPQDEAHVMADALLPRLRDNVSTRRSWLLDITTDIGVPCVAAVSSMEDGFALAFGLAARPTLTAAVGSAILEMCQIELAHAVVEAKCSERGEAALNERDRVHRRRATMINADRCLLLQPVAERANI